jgi:hypothetical protein
VFFDDHPRFLETSNTASSRRRLNMRYEAMIADNVDVLRGARVLDLASHDGRWSFAALKVGAAHVTGIEARQHLVANARRSFDEEGIDADDYEFRLGDMFTELRLGDIKVDVIMCLGFLYHTLRYPELLFGMQMTGAKHVILDTNVLRNREGAVIALRSERNRIEANAAADELTLANRTLSGLPSVPAVLRMFEAYGYRLDKQFDWQLLAERYPHEGAIPQYTDGDRVTMRFVRED